LLDIYDFVLPQSNLTEFVRSLAGAPLVFGGEMIYDCGMKRPSIEPRTDEAQPERRVIFLVLPGVQLLDLAGPVQVFDTARRIFAVPYTILFCAASSEIRSTQRLYISRLEPLPEINGSDLVLVPGTGGPLKGQKLLDAASKRWLQESYQAGAHIASICTGANALGEAGLLHKRRCTTHWADVAELRASCPTAQVLEGVLYVHDRGITTSAGVASGIDMALWLLERDCGPRLAADVARYLVVYLRRSGLERQMSVYLEYRAHLDPCVHKVQDWLAEHVGEPVTLEDLAVVAQTSVRSLTRSFKAAAGITPHEYQQLLRLELAAHLVRDSALPLETIAAKCGFGDPRHFRRVWRQRFGTPPSHARQQTSHAG
jgi:transcriptional regulator GlxA family with amidase domain